MRINLVDFLLSDNFLSNKFELLNLLGAKNNLVNEILNKEKI